MRSITVPGLGGGTKDKIQDELRVGVGTLAGSTVMLLTIPWAVSAASHFPCSTYGCASHFMR